MSEKSPGSLATLASNYGRVLIWPRLEQEELDGLAGAIRDTRNSIVDFRATHKESPERTLLTFQGFTPNERLPKLLRYASKATEYLGAMQLRWGVSKYTFVVGMDNPPAEVPQLDTAIQAALVTTTFNEDNALVFSRAHFGFNQKEQQAEFAPILYKEIAPSLGRVVMPNVVIPCTVSNTDLFTRK